MPERNISFEIVEYLGVISKHKSGWAKELNLISWNNGTPKYDIREWDEDHVHMSRGVTLHEAEMRKVVDLYFDAKSQGVVAEGRSREARQKEKQEEYLRKRFAAKHDSQLEKAEAASLEGALLSEPDEPEGAELFDVSTDTADSGDFADSTDSVDSTCTADFTQSDDTVQQEEFQEIPVSEDVSF